MASLSLSFPIFKVDVNDGVRLGCATVFRQQASASLSLVFPRKGPQAKCNSGLVCAMLLTPGCVTPGHKAAPPQGCPLPAGGLDLIVLCHPRTSFRTMLGTQ